jgi:hypothetical protein
MFEIFFEQNLVQSAELIYLDSFQRVVVTMPAQAELEELLEG